MIMEMLSMENRLKKDRVWVKGLTLTQAQIEEKRENNIISMTMGFIGSLASAAILGYINTHYFPALPVTVRAPLALVLYLAVALVPIIMMRQDKMKLSDIGLEKKNIPLQIVIGIALGLITSLMLTCIPFAAGFGKFVASGKDYRTAAQFAYEFIYCIAAVGFAEEFVFRGFIYRKLSDIFEKESIAIIGSSVLFGLFHIFNGNILQVIFTTALGFIYCAARKKIKGCTLLSLMICHGIYDAMIAVWTYIFLNR